MILITGANGQLGTELKNYLDELKKPYIATDSAELDIADQDAVEKFIAKMKPTVIYHCAAYTQVDNSEVEGKDLAYKINVEGTQFLADAAKKYDVNFVYISTDYVFDGKNDGEYKEEDSANPLNVYGLTKYLGEEAVRKTLTNYYIIRTSWVFGKYGNNFVFTMQRLASERSQLTIVNDQVGRPTWTRTLAEFMVHLVDSKAEYGTYHLSNDGQCSWFDFASEILKEKNVEVLPVTSDQFVQLATRPQHSVLSLEKAKLTGFNIPHWKEALKQMLEGANTID